MDPDSGQRGGVVIDVWNHTFNVETIVEDEFGHVIGVALVGSPKSRSIVRGDYINWGEFTENIKVYPSGRPQGNWFYVQHIGFSVPAPNNTTTGRFRLQRELESD